MTISPQNPRDEDEVSARTQPPDSDQNLADRKASLDHALRKTQKERAEKQAPSGTSMAGYAAAFRLSTEFIAGIAVGTLIGWLIDQLAGIAPFGMIAFLMLGFVAGVFNVLRSAGLMADPHSRLPSAEIKARNDQSRTDSRSDSSAK